MLLPCVGLYFSPLARARGPRPARQGAIHANGIGGTVFDQFTQVFLRRYVFRCSGSFASPTFSGGSCASRTSLPLPPVARFATLGGAAVDGPPRPHLMVAVHDRAARRSRTVVRETPGWPQSPRPTRGLPDAHRPPHSSRQPARIRRPPVATATGPSFVASPVRCAPAPYSQLHAPRAGHRDNRSLDGRRGSSAMKGPA